MRPVYSRTTRISTAAGVLDRHAFEPDRAVRERDAERLHGILS